MTSLVGRDEVLGALGSAFPARFARSNEEALDLGIERGRALVGGR
jgi:hypothetical protein